MYCLMDILNCVTQQVLQRALGITILSNLHKPGLILNISLEEACTPLDRRNYLGPYIPRDFLPCPFVPPLPQVSVQWCCVVWAVPAQVSCAGAHSQLSVSPRWSSSPDLCSTVAWHSQHFIRNDPLCSQSLTIPLLSRIKFEFSPVSPEDHLPRHKSACSY